MVRIEETAQSKDGDVIMAAVLDGDLNHLDMLLKQSPEALHFQNNKGESPLHLAVKLGKVEVVALLIRHGADKSAALDTAVEFGKMEVLALLIQQGVHDISAALDAAVKLGKVDVVSQLIEQGADKSGALDTAVKFGKVEVVARLIEQGAVDRSAALDTAVKLGNVDVVARLIEQGADKSVALDTAVKLGKVDVVSQLIKQGADKSGALDTAVKFGKVEVVARLIEQGAVDRSAALDTAVKLGSVDVVARLIEQGADKSVALGTAVKHEKEKVVARLVELGADPSSALHEACLVRKGDTIVKALLSGAGTEEKVDCTNEHGQTPLHFAAGRGIVDVATLLINKGASLDKTDHTGAGVLHFAARGGKERIFDLFKESWKKHKGEDLNVNQATEKAGLTPLHYAAWNGKDKATTWLIEQGADITKEDKVEGGMPWHWAVMGGDRSTVRLIIRAHMEQKKKLFREDDEKNWLNLFRRVEDHDQRDLLDLPGWIVLNAGKMQELVQPGLLACIAAYGDGATCKELRNHLTREADKNEEVTREMVTNAFMPEWAVLLRKESTGYQVQPVMEVLSKLGVEGTHLVNAFRYALKESKFTLAESLIGPWAYDLVKVVVQERVSINWELLSKKRNVLSDAKQMGQDIPMAYWVTKLHMKGDDAVTKAQDDDKTKKLAEWMHKSLNKCRKTYPNDQGPISGRTALHWATIFQEEETVRSLCTKWGFTNAGAFDNHGKAAYWYASSWERAPMDCLMWSDYIPSLHKDRELLVDGLNAILVGSALISSVTFAGFLSPPLNYSWKPSDGGEDTVKYVPINKAGVMAFSIFNSLSFFFGMASALAGVTGVLPIPDVFTLEVVMRTRWILVAAASLLVISILFVLLAFGAAGLSVIPPLLKYQGTMIGTCTAGGLLCLAMLAWFLFAIHQVVLPWSKLLVWDSKSSQKKGQTQTEGQTQRKDDEKFSGPLALMNHFEFKQEGPGLPYRPLELHPFDDGLDQVEPRTAPPSPVHISLSRGASRPPLEAVINLA